MGIEISVLQDARATALIGSMIGVPARANILAALVSGQALTATELAVHAGVTPQTASSHLKKMTDAELLKVERQGRHRYYRLADARIADALEPLAHLVSSQPVVHRHPSKLLTELRHSRMCYDHMAGVLGVTITDALLAQNLIVASEESFAVTEAGATFFRARQIDLDDLHAKRRHFARRCLDWSERRPHIGGALGAAIAAQFLKDGWINRVPDSRKITLTRRGTSALRQHFGIHET